MKILMLLLVIPLTACAGPKKIDQLVTKNIPAMQAFQQDCLSSEWRYVNFTYNAWNDYWVLTCYENNKPKGFKNEND